MKMKQYLLSCALCVFPLAASAADLPVKAPASVQPSYSWTGAYGGLHAGVGWFNDSGSTATAQRLSGPGPAPRPASAALNSSAFPFGGGQIGYNWQLAPRWVVGLETDFSVSNHSELSTVLSTGAVTDTVTSTRGLDWFGTVRGRAGYLIDPRVLTYVTGGLAYGHTRNEFNQSINPPGPGGTIRFLTTSSSGTRTGWTAGAGIEYALDAKWSVKAEYDYVAFNDGVSSRNTISFAVPGAPVYAFNVQAANNSTHIVQIGLNYHFWAR
jgi:outer membrane immunogenic protein